MKLEVKTPIVTELAPESVISLQKDSPKRKPMKRKGWPRKKSTDRRRDFGE